MVKNLVSYQLVDAKDTILGRLASNVAKNLLLGKKIVIVNAKDCWVSGKRDSTFNRYLERQEIHTASNPRRGPFWPHRPDNLLKRTIRGMLPKNKRGKEALKRLHVYITGIPASLRGRYGELEPVKYPKCDVSRIQYKAENLEAICTRIGWKNKYIATQEES
ncbi:MAG: 50S ribosomal protein L13 [Promethearchaeota archaeon]